MPWLKDGRVTPAIPGRAWPLLFALATVPASHAGSWVLVDQGDCPGPQIIGSAGVLPEDELCTPAFAGKTALCFTQVCYPGCQYIDVPTTQCRGGAEMANVYTCAPAAEPAPRPPTSPRHD